MDKSCKSRNQSTYGPGKAVQRSCIWGRKELDVLKNHPLPPRSCLFRPLTLRSTATPLFNASVTGPPNSRALFTLLLPRAVSGTSCFASQDDSQGPLGTTVQGDHPLGPLGPPMGPMAHPFLFIQTSCSLCLCCRGPPSTSFLCCMSSQRSVPSLQDYLPNRGEGDI